MSDGYRDLFTSTFRLPKDERAKRTLAAFLEGIENAKPAAAKKASYRANVRRKRFLKSDRPAQESPK